MVAMMENYDEYTPSYTILAMNDGGQKAREAIAQLQSGEFPGMVNRETI